MPKTKISLFALILLIVAAIDSIRNLPAAALFGHALPFFFLLAALLFLVPTALVAAELSALFPDKGGIYHWVHQAFGPRWAMTAIWLQWINTVVWYPTILSFIAGTAAYFFAPELAENSWYLISVVLVVFWGVTLLNLRGLALSAKINSVCVLLGTVFPICLLIGLGAWWVFSGEPLQLTWRGEWLPNLGESTQWTSLVAIMASFLGMELAGVHVNEIEAPQRNFPKALFLSALIIFATMLFGSLAIAFVVPGDEINLVSGVMQLFDRFFDTFGMRWFTPILTLLIVVGSIGSIINWLLSPAKGLLHAAEFGFLPPLFAKTNRFGVPLVILLLQALLVSLCCTLFLLVPTVNAFYWFFTALSTALYMVMYILMFFAAIRLRSKGAHYCGFKIPGGPIVLWTIVIAGLFGCVTTIVVSFFPPDRIDVGSPLLYVGLIVLGYFFTITPLFLFFRHQRNRSKT